MSLLHPWQTLDMGLSAQAVEAHTVRSRGSTPAASTLATDPVLVSVEVLPLEVLLGGVLVSQITGWGLVPVVL